MNRDEHREAGRERGVEGRRGVRGGPARARALAEFRRARDEMHQAFARARSQGVATKEEEQELKRTLKAGRNATHGSLEAIRDLARRYSLLARTFADRLPRTPDGEGEPDDPGAAPSAVPVPRGPGGPRAPRRAGAASAALPVEGEEAVPDDAARVQPDTWGEEQLREFGQKYLLACLLSQGVPVREALARVGLDRSERWARKVRRRFEEEGHTGLLDRRMWNGRAVGLMTAEVRQLVFRYWIGRPAAGPRAVWSMVAPECERLGLPVPGEESVKKYLAGLPRPLQLFRAGKIGEWDKQDRPVVEFQMSVYANERWQADHARLDVWVRARADGRWVPREVWITSALDEFSRAIPGFVLSARTPDAWTVSQLLLQAIRPKERPGWRVCGLPEVLQTDRGKDFTSHAVLTALAQLKVRVDPDPPHYPNRKGKKERFYRTLDQGCLRRLPGHMDAVGRTETSAAKHVHLLLTVEQLRAEIEHWIVEEYHERTHSGTDRKPIELWEERVRLRLPDDEEVFRVLMVRSDRLRRVRRTGIRFHPPGGEGGTYWAPVLVEHAQRDVRIAYHPADPRYVLAYDADTGEFIGECWIMGQPDSRYGIGDVKQTRTRFRRGLKRRVEEYRREVHRQDAERAREDWTEARQLKEELVLEAPVPTTESDELSALLRELEQQDRH